MHKNPHSNHNLKLEKSGIYLGRGVLGSVTISVVLFSVELELVHEE